MLLNKKMGRLICSPILFSVVILIVISCSSGKKDLLNTGMGSIDTLQFLTRIENEDNHLFLFLTKSMDTISASAPPNVLLRDDMVAATIDMKDATSGDELNKHYKQALLYNVEIIDAKPFEDTAKEIIRSIDAWVKKLESAKLQKIKYPIDMNFDPLKSKSYMVNKGTDTDGHFYLVNESWHAEENTDLRELTYYFNSNGEICRMDEFVIEKSTWRSEYTTRYYFEDRMPFWKYSAHFYKESISNEYEEKLTPDDDYYDKEVFLSRRSVEETIMKLSPETK